VFKQRLKGNAYCKLDYNERDKYRAINFGHDLGTIEFRIFSMCMRRKLAQECVDFVKNQVERFLRTHKQFKPVKIRMARYCRAEAI